MPDPEVRALYQPIVDLETGAVLGFEALARGPAGTPLESPLALLADARAKGTSERSTGGAGWPPSRARWPPTWAAR
jgi:sensor c-di-GMP phosphodiesterase-like protein